MMTVTMVHGNWTQHKNASSTLQIFHGLCHSAQIQNVQGCQHSLGSGKGQLSTHNYDNAWWLVTLEGESFIHGHIQRTIRGTAWIA
jgi:hypothetical protein